MSTLTVAGPQPKGLIRRYMNGEHEIAYIPGLYYYAKGPQGGHMRLFGAVGRGVVIYQYQDSSSYGYSRMQCWIIPGIVALVHHDNEGGKLKSRDPQTGWFLRWFRFSFERIYSGFTVKLRGPETYIG